MLIKYILGLSILFMWKDSVELKVIRLEGFPCSSTELACYLYYNDALHDQLLPINEEKSLVLTEDGLYRLEINNQNNQEEKTVSFQMSLFKEDGVRWLPLFSSNQDFITEIPDDVNLPRILIIFYRKRMLSVIDEKSSGEEIAEPPPHESIFELHDEPLVSAVIPDDKIIQDYKIALEYERKLRDDQEKNILRLSKELHDALERSQIREDSLLQLITVKEEELLSAQSEITSLRSKTRKAEIEKTQLSDMLESVKAERQCLNIEGLYKELEMFTHYFKDCEEIMKIKAKLEAFENKELAFQEQEKLVLEYMKGKNVDINKEIEPLYTIGQKKISITVRGGILFYRLLGPSIRFDEFFNASPERSMTPSTKIARRNGSDSKFLENDSKQGISKRVNTSFNSTKKKF